MHTGVKFRSVAIALLIALSTSFLAASGVDLDSTDANCELQLAEWAGIIQNESANAILASASRSFPPDKDTITFKINLADLREICRKAEDSGALEGGSMAWNTWQSDIASEWYYCNSELIHRRNEFWWSLRGDVNRGSIGWRNDYISVAEKDIKVTAEVEMEGWETKEWKITADVFETLRPGEAAVLIFRPKDFSRGYSFLKVWHVEAIPAALESTIYFTEFSTWLRYGIDGIAHSNTIAQVWGAGAPTVETSEKWTTKLPFGSLQLAAISRPRLAPFTRWTPDGAPALPDTRGGILDLGAWIIYTSTFAAEANRSDYMYFEIEDTENLEIHASIGDGPWEELGRIENGETSLEVGDSLFVAQVEQAGEYLPIDGVIPTSIDLQWPSSFDREVQLVAVEKTGTEHLSPDPGISISLQPTHPEPRIFHVFPFDFANFDHLIIRTRPYQKAVFRGFQSEPPEFPSVDKADAGHYHRRKQVPHDCFAEIELPLNDELEGSNGQASIIYQVMKNGMCTSVREIRGEGTRDNEMVLLSKEQVRMAEKLVKDLRNSKSDLPPSQTVTVRSYEENELTSVYNRQKLPKRLNALFEIIGRRKELESQGKLQ